MRQSTSYRFMRSVSGQLLFVLALLGLLLLGSRIAHAAPVSSTAASEIAEDSQLFGKKNRSPWHRNSHQQTGGERSSLHRKGWLGRLLPRHSRNELAEKHRAAHHSPMAARYHGRNGRKATFWKRIGLKS